MPCARIYTPHLSPPEKPPSAKSKGRYSIVTTFVGILWFPDGGITTQTSFTLCLHKHNCDNDHQILTANMNKHGSRIL